MLSRMQIRPQPLPKCKSSQHPSLPTNKILLTFDPKEKSRKGGSGFGVSVIGGKLIPGGDGEIGAFIANILPGSQVAHLRDAVREGDQVWIIGSSLFGSWG